MSDVQLYLIEVSKNKDEAGRIAGGTAKKLEQKQSQLISVIESVGDYINDEDDTTRTQSLAYLADVLEQLSARIFSLQQRNLLVEFVLSRIQDDVPSVAPSCRALVALESMGKWDPESVKKIITTLIESANPLKQFKLQAERYSILQLVDLLLAKYRQAVTDRAQDDFDFIARFVDFFEGEKDPRNLMIIFSVVSVPMAEWSLGPSTQDMFDLVFNYFPITFKPPPGDPYGITAQDLKDRLRSCIATTSDFAPYAFPALLDKLDSSSMNTKRDVLQAIIACVRNYEPRTISLYSVTLWDALKFEILNVQEEDLAESALEALGAIALQLSLASEGAVTAYLKPIVKECNEHFEDAPTKQSEAAARILNSIAKSSPVICDSIIKGVMPSLLTLFQSADSIVKRRGLVEVIIKLLQAIISVSSSWQTRDEAGLIASDRAENHAFRAFTNDTVELLLQAVISAPVSEISFRLYSLQALKYFVTIRQLLAESHAVRILSACTDIIIHESETANDETIAAAIDTIIAASKQHPTSAVERALPALVAQLPDVPEPGIFAYEAPLEVLAKLSVEATLANTVIIRLKNKLEAAQRQNAPQTYILGLLGALLYVFTYGAPESEDGIVKISYLTDVVLPWLEEARRDVKSPFHSEICIDLLSRITNLILHSQSQHVQNQVVSSLGDLFSAISDITKSPEAEVQNVAGSALNIIPSLYIHAALRVDPNGNDATPGVTKAVLQVCHSENITQTSRAYALRHLSLLVLKFTPPQSLEATIEGWTPSILPADSGRGPHAAEALLAVAKGAILRGKNNKFASSVLRQLFGLLNTEGLSLTVAFGLGRIFANDELMSKENYCAMSGLYKQRTYAQCSELIREGFSSAPAPTKSSYLVALAEILRNIPYDIVKPTIGSIVPLILQVLDLAESGFTGSKSSALVTLEAILLYDPATLNEYATSIITRLLECTDARKNHESVRAAALRCLKAVPTQLKRETVIPYRRQVVRRLLVGLDDARRAVRTEAVRCRGAWLDLDKEDEDDE